MTYQNQDQRHKYHHLTTALHLTQKVTTAQVVEMSVTNNSLPKDDLHPDDYAKQITDTPGFKTFTTINVLVYNGKTTVFRRFQSLVEVLWVFQPFTAKGEFD